MYPLDDTIAAIASPPGGAARGIVRLSGPEARACVETLFQPDAQRRLSLLAAPTAVPGSIFLAGTNSTLPCELYCWPHGRSYTGQPVAELHTLGSPPMLEAVLRGLCAAGARGAQPGEFTLRAFLAGRIDLTQAEAVLGVIDAADQNQLDVALTQLAGGLAGPLHRLRDQLIELLAHLEAGFDFADEDLSFITAGELDNQLDEARRNVQRLARQMASRGETGGAARAVLVGSPNTGKSSLFNALASETAALVHRLPGTTRDYLTAELDLDGVKCQLIDTAGMGPEHQRSPADVQRAAREVASQQSRRAHVQIFCIDSSRPLDDWERGELARPAGAERLLVLTKIDLPRQTDCTHQVVKTSSLTGGGIDALRDAIRHAVLTAAASDAGVVAGTAARCRQSLRLAGDCLKRARDIARGDTGEELVAAEVRAALDELGKVVGAVYTDDVLDRIFSRFCIGK